MALITNNFLVDVLICIGTIILALYKYVSWNFNYWKDRNVPFISPTPFFGNVYETIISRKSVGGLLKDLYQKMPGAQFFGIWVFRTPGIIICSPEVIKLITVKDFNYFANRSAACDPAADSIFSNMMLLAHDEVWRRLRGKSTAMFTSGKMRNMTPLIQECSKEMNEYLFKVSKQGPVDAKDVAAKFSTDVITSCAFGIHAHSFRSENAPFRVFGRRMFQQSFGNGFRAMSYYFMPWIVSTFKVPFFHSSIGTFCRETFWQIIDERKRSGMIRKDLIDMVIEMINRKEVEGDTAVSLPAQFFAAGFETVSSIISFALFELAGSEKCQTRLREELKNVVDGNEELTYEALKEFKYLTQVINETLRKYPSLPFLDRRCVQTYKCPNTDLVIERGTPVYIPIHALHFDEQYFENPKVFDPERFNEMNIAKIKPYTYLPFGVGPRNCIGETLGLLVCKLGVASIIANFSLQLEEPTPKECDFDPRGFVLIPKSNLLLKFTSIKN